MFTASDYLSSVTDIFAIWLVALASLLVLTRVATRWVRTKRATVLFTHQRGANYTLGVIALLPFYILVIAVVLECAMLMVVKLGTMYAAFAAARSAIVWLPAEIPDEYRLAMIHIAGGQALAPFASSADKHLVGVPDAATSTANSNSDYAAVVNDRSFVSISSHYLENKRRYALTATSIKIEIDEFRTPARISSSDGRVVVDYIGKQKSPGPVAAHADLRVTVSFEKPIDLPGVGRILGKLPSWPAARFYTRVISTTVTLENEGPKSTNQTLGIHYPSWGY